MCSAPSSSANQVAFAAHLLTLFPEMFPGPLGHSLAGRGLNKAIWSLECYNIRDFATDKHANVDAPPFGGGHGMVMRPDVMGRVIDHVCNKQPAGQNLAKLYPSPRGKLLDQDMARSLSQKDGVMIVCGRYEGLDQRVIDHYQLQEVSIGDYVLSGGEQAAMVILDAVVRLLPGIMGKEVSHLEDLRSLCSVVHAEVALGIAPFTVIESCDHAVEWFDGVLCETVGLYEVGSSDSLSEFE